MEGREQEATVAQVLGSVEDEDRARAHDRLEDAVAPTAVEARRAVAGEDLADGAGVGEEDDGPERHEPDREGVAVAAPAVLHEGERAHRPAQGLGHGREARAGRERHPSSMAAAPGRARRAAMARRSAPPTRSGAARVGGDGLRGLAAPPHEGRREGAAQTGPRAPPGARMALAARAPDRKGHDVLGRRRGQRCGAVGLRRGGQERRDLEPVDGLRRDQRVGEGVEPGAVGADELHGVEVGLGHEPAHLLVDPLKGGVGHADRPTRAAGHDLADALGEAELLHRLPGEGVGLLEVVGRARGDGAHGDELGGRPASTP